MTPAEAAAALGLPHAALDERRDGGGAFLPVADCGQRCLLVAVRTLEATLGCAPDYATLRAFVEAEDLAAVVLHPTETFLADRALRPRVFPPVFSYLEDPATGSGNAALATGSGGTGRGRPMVGSGALALSLGVSRASLVGSTPQERLRLSGSPWRLRAL